MRHWFVLVFVSVMCAVWLSAQTGAQAPAPERRPASTMRQLMRGMVFTNANVIFSAQLDDPASIPGDARPSMSTNPLTGLYGGWQAIENSSLALADLADLLNAPGRVCSNDKPVPVGAADWKAAVETMRDAAGKAAAAARARNLDRMFEVAGELTSACSGCHRIYRARDNPCEASRPGQ